MNPNTEGERNMLMKKLLQYLLPACVALGLAASLWAAVDADYQAAMKAAGAACGRVKKGIDAKASGDEIAKDATEVADNFKKMGAYWMAHPADDAMASCKQGFAAATAIAKAAKAGNMDEVNAEFKNLTGSCGSCHKAHRDKAADGSWIIK
jgi:cytochrome c556